MATASELLAAYDEQTRVYLPERPPAGQVYERVGPLLRQYGAHRGFVESGPRLPVVGAELDALIAEQRDFFAARGESVEWKTRVHDQPADLPERLLAAGFVPEDEETVLVGEAAALAAHPAEVAGVVIRTVDKPADFERIAAMQCEVWGDELGWLAADLAQRQAGLGADFVVWVAEDGDRVVSSAWLVRRPDTQFAGLWGGSTLPGWRGRGIYRALVAARARVALTLGATYLQVDASPDSRPILERLGFVVVTHTTPYVWSPQTGL